LQLSTPVKTQNTKPDFPFKLSESMSNPAYLASSLSNCASDKFPHVNNDEQSRRPQPPPSNNIVSIEDYNILDEIDVDVMQIDFLSVDEPAFLVHYASDAEIHTALGASWYHYTYFGSCVSAMHGSSIFLSV
jgi:hypothetical protein